MIISDLNILFIQRVITGYRLELIKELANYYKHVGIISSKGNTTGTLKIVDYSSATDEYNNLSIFLLSSIKIQYRGESRETSLFFYPKSLKFINNYDIIVFEGTTNIINNYYLIPYARFLNKKVIFWDAGYSLNKRTLKRKIIDAFNIPLLKLSHLQMAYSNLAKSYMEKYMGADNVFVNLNTINTSYFDGISKEIYSNAKSYKLNKNDVQLLYVGIVEERKKIKELIEIVLQLNKNSKRFSLTIIGSGKDLENLKREYNLNFEIKFIGALYDYDKLKSYYFNSDLFILPGDGGLAILQSLLFGLPVISVKGADGTELDYIKHKPFLLNNLNELPLLLENIESIDRLAIYQSVSDINSKNWMDNLNNKIAELV